MDHKKLLAASATHIRRVVAEFIKNPSASNYDKVARATMIYQDLMQRAIAADRVAAALEIAAKYK